MIIERELQNLWPSLEEIDNADLTPPVVIMRQQAEFISDLTNNILEGQVINEKVYLESVPHKQSPFTTSILDIKQASEPIENTRLLKYVFILRPLALGDAKVRLFAVTHALALVYPVEFQSSIIMEEIEPKHETANDEDAFRSLLQRFFHSNSVKRVLQSLMAQSR